MLGIYCRTSREADTETSTISQQRTAGVKFAVENKFEYEVYEDEGKSGYKISDDEQDPFNNRPAFTNLINDIKNKKIDKVWVWEHSRLSRNQYASAFIFNVFEKFKITLYENNKELKLDDPNLKFMRQMLDAVAEYERQLIVARTTRGLRKRINEGKRAHFKLYGYGKNGKDEQGHTIWVPVESELSNYKYALKRYMEGASLMKIYCELYDINKLDKWQFARHSSRLGRILRKYQYTGYQLTIEGFDIYKRFRNNEIDNLQILLDKDKYWVKSAHYYVELISIEDWVKIVERLQIQTIKMRKARKDILLRASKDIATGLVECGDCGSRFYYKEQRPGKYKNGELKIYFSYCHMSKMNGYTCKQRPKSFKLDDINNIFKLFYFYFYIVFDNTNDLIKESQRNIKQTQLKLKERISHIEKQTAVIEKRISKFNRIMDNSDEDTVIKVLTERVEVSRNEYEKLNIELSKLKIDYELQNEKFNKTLLEMTYYDVAERINDWFFKLNVEDQRNELIRIIKKCKIFNHYIIIDTGKIVFLFDIFKKEVFDMKLLENLNRGIVYKSHFIEMKNRREARKLNDKLIHNINLNRDKEIRMRVFQYLAKEYGIIYDISEHANLISFVPLTGILSLEVEQFGTEE